MVRFRAAVLLSSACATSAAAQSDPIAVGRSFLQAVLAGDVDAIRKQRTADAMVVIGDIGGPMKSVEKLLANAPGRSSCSIGRLTVLPEPVPADPALPSVKRGEGRFVDGTLSCEIDGETKLKPVRLVISRGKVAALTL